MNDGNMLARLGNSNISSIHIADPATIMVAVAEEMGTKMDRNIGVSGKRRRATQHG
jgi:hypothetical protein